MAFSRLRLRAPPQKLLSARRTGTRAASSAGQKHASPERKLEKWNAPARYWSICSTVPHFRERLATQDLAGGSSTSRHGSRSISTVLPYRLKSKGSNYDAPSTGRAKMLVADQPDEWELPKLRASFGFEVRTYLFSLVHVWISVSICCFLTFPHHVPRL